MRCAVDASQTHAAQSLASPTHCINFKGVLDATNGVWCAGMSTGASRCVHPCMRLACMHAPKWRRAMRMVVVNLVPPMMQAFQIRQVFALKIIYRTSGPCLVMLTITAVRSLSSRRRSRACPRPKATPVSAMTKEDTFDELIAYIFEYRKMGAFSACSRCSWQCRRAKKPYQAHGVQCVSCSRNRSACQRSRNLRESPASPSSIRGCVPARTRLCGPSVRPSRRIAYSRRCSSIGPAESTRGPGRGRFTIGFKR